MSVDWDDRMIDNYVAKYGEDASLRVLVRALGLTGDEDVLDVGCGTGVALRAAPIGRGRRVGVEPFDRMLAHAQSAAAKMSRDDLEFVKASGESLPFAAECFDRVMVFNVIHHQKSANQGLTEAFRVLRRGGVLAVGGDVFDEERVPGGQDYTLAMANAGFGNFTNLKPGEGLYVTLAEKPKDNTV